ncbi:MHYT domain-containing protein [Streptomyces aidingensis]|uniref:MHYT domain-containing protein, NO-binding membrane sensor n=1 Tax=Streptomyces aidingensis TaxID=910347 RepID=A0A1I1IMP2_9ACTN|nr:MHYT domain-containing protein [Streptomyces aidingensis]SFC37181.1 MHYT domain-containing protein, NO-binding membrane sensor [Streptomyces aidingensis]
MVVTAASAVPVEGFAYGPLTPVLGFAMAVLGSALGLRCTVRALATRGGTRAGWLGLGAVAIGTGIFTMHFIAMMGFAAGSLRIGYDMPLTYASLLTAILVVGVGVFLVGYGRGATGFLLCGGLAGGLGVAAMHYMGMASMRMDGELSYSALSVAASVAVAVVAATTALWFAVSISGLRAALGASVIMGVAVTGMHYTGMTGISVHSDSPGAHPVSGSPVEVLLPVLIIPVLLLVFTSLFVGLDPMTTEDIQRARRDGADGGPPPPDPPGGPGGGASRGIAATAR